ncbi:O-sialoglycoprotein endopeptidase [Cavenderia fasciculata]|uniref:N(6)-L-threonylcarbamoyladenine synthase n=1 Tax=Cavenderia fasciculata TaxID=261658 RepID=F4PYE4_CACFS|nr:O-sialoglycoprotein endopeptidase [Cavenderia fasciculata]EGG19411.1 O-sialoglycoprotein endopeptidase [Cavenderia fasciculata]|eukprot:XP_004357682.1 O-sialoglycoprotein endopeptidase [Cavenderia fasciculata]
MRRTTCSSQRLSLIRSSHYTTTTTTTSKSMKEKIVMGIETSCDDTSVAIVKGDRTILSQCDIAQWDIHRKFGGIVPKLAKESHEKNIDRAIECALKDANKSIEEIDAIAVTMGPGIAFSLDVGLEKARQLAKKHSIPFLGVNHLEGHCLTCRLSDEGAHVQFPFLVLLVSGGHTQLLICHAVGQYTQIGNTLDDSVGEALDKAARLLGCEFGELHDGEKLYKNIHGGEAIEILAKKGNHKGYTLPIPMVSSLNCDFSFSGLKSHLKKTIDSLKEKNQQQQQQQQQQEEQDNTTNDNKLQLVGGLTNQQRYDLAASFQFTVFMHLVKKTERAFDWYIHNTNKTISQATSVPSKKSKSSNQNNNQNNNNNNNQNNGSHGDVLLSPPTCLVVTGGVSKNQMLRKFYQEISSFYKLPVVFPNPSLCTDNGAMIAWAGIEMLKEDLNIDPDDAFYIPVWPLDPSPPTLFATNLTNETINQRKKWFTDTVEKYSPTGQLPLPLKQKLQQNNNKK